MKTVINCAYNEHILGKGILASVGLLNESCVIDFRYPTSVPSWCGITRRPFSVLLCFQHSFLLHVYDVLYFLELIDSRKQKRRTCTLVHRKKSRRLLPYTPSKDVDQRLEQMQSLTAANMEFSNDLTTLLVWLQNLQTKLIWKMVEFRLALSLSLHFAYAYKFMAEVKDFSSSFCLLRHKPAAVSAASLSSPPPQTPHPPSTIQVLFRLFLLVVKGLRVRQSCRPQA
ncbi:putative [histone H3]-lysine(4) N-trimethyltransferase [Helianthus anomalus]